MKNIYKKFSPITILIVILILAVGSVAYFSRKDSSPAPEGIQEVDYQNQTGDSQSPSVPAQKTQTKKTTSTENVPDVSKAISMAGNLAKHTEELSANSDNQNFWNLLSVDASNITKNTELFFNDDSSCSIQEELTACYSPSFRVGDKVVVSGTITSGKILVKTLELNTVGTYRNQPGAIKSITAQGGSQWLFVVDLLSGNSDWTPGGEVSFFVNQNPKLRSLNVSNITKTYKCNPNADLLTNTTIYISEIQNEINNGNYAYSKEFVGPVRYFDIDGDSISAIYEQCLP